MLARDTLEARFWRLEGAHEWAKKCELVYLKPTYFLCGLFYRRHALAMSWYNAIGIEGDIFD